MRSLALLALACQPALAQDITSARLTLPTDRYDHAVLGDALEWAGLEMTLSDGRTLRVTLPSDRVFEDIEARLADLDGDGRPEVVVVETSLTKGASLAVYDASGKRAATAHIGQRNRWLAPAGITDFDGDGQVEIAYVDRPHLARELVFVRLTGRKLTEVARAPGFTNHRIGDSRIAGGVRTCNDQTALLVASADWSRLMQVTLSRGGITATDIGPWPSSGPNLKTCP
ncbi:MAG: VCBS repeat-containing protein [Rhodobacteraceae bacterium]|nr:VCBS repeat-containing protein [Paracoccaceae bacterium]